MIFRSPGRVAHDALEDFEYSHWANFEAGFLAHFTRHRVLQRFAEFQQSTGQRPPPLERLLAALRQQNAIAPQNNRAHSDQRPLRISPVIYTGPPRPAPLQAAPFTSIR